MSDVRTYPIPASQASTAVGSAVSNPHPGSNVTVPVAETVLSWEVQKNLYNDTLPIIPSSSHVQSGKILYQLKIKITLTQVSGGSPCSHKAITIKSNRSGDVIRPGTLMSDAEGTALITLESRNPGDLQLSVENPDISAEPLAIDLKEAWYEKTFLITGYHVCFESDFTGVLVIAHGTNDQHKSDFLYGARGVVMQGTGKASNGRYIRPTQVNSDWHRNSHGNRDYLDNPDGVAFTYTNSVQGAYGPVTENHSIAVDSTVIPKRSQVEIEMVGIRFADDTGSAIIGNHIDNFVGAGAAVQAAWESGPVNNTHRKVKYIGF
jgi:3D (Asp-Asp-Asp) domain-containing protein